MGTKSGYGDEARKRQGKHVSARGRKKSSVRQYAPGASGNTISLLGEPETIMRALEPRVLLDAAMADTIDEIGNDFSSIPAPTDHQWKPGSAAYDNQFGTGGDGPDPWRGDDEADSGTGATSALSVEIVFIDPAVSDVEAILAELDPGLEVILLDADSDGVQQIAAHLQGKANVDAIHIISHGRSGTLDLGNAKLTAASLASRHADEAAVIRAALGEDADILIYGCDFAAGTRGLNAVNALMEATGADVAASNDLTGAAILGGDWDLEVRAGDVEATVLAFEGFQGLLAPLIISVDPANSPLNQTVPLNGSVTYGNAGTVNGVVVDLRATVTAIDPNTDILFSIFGDDASLGIETSDTSTGGSVTVLWEIFEAGTTNPVAGEPTITVADIDGTGGTPGTVETIAPNLTGLASYTTAQSTNLDVSSAGGLVEVSGTESGNPATREGAAVTFAWSTTSSFEITYTAHVENNRRFFDHDGDGDFSFSGPTSTNSAQPVDTDGDGVTDDVDVDDDNDGILDEFEGYSDGTSLGPQQTVGASTIAPGAPGAPVTTFGPHSITGPDGTSITITDTTGNQTTLDGGLGYRLGTDNAVADRTYTITFDQPVNNVELGLSFLNNDVGFNFPAGEEEITNFSVNAGTVSLNWTDDGDGVHNTSFDGTSISTAPGGFGPQSGGTMRVSSTEPFTTLTLSYDTIQSNPFGAILNQIDYQRATTSAPTSRDTDGDGIADHLDLDSDNDGLTDNFEAQRTIGYIAPSGVGAGITDLNNDGLDDSYDNRTVTAASAAATIANARIVPVNTDAGSTIGPDINPDYIDTDSDGDALNDTGEAGLGIAPIANGTLSNASNDADGDGLFDVFDTQGGTTNNDGFVVNEGILSPAALFPDDDNDVSGNQPLTQDVDYRDQDPATAGSGADTDGDGVDDDNDIDDDNDGILDVNEMTLTQGTRENFENPTNPVSQSGRDLFDFVFNDPTQTPLSNFAGSAGYFNNVDLVGGSGTNTTTFLPAYEGDAYSGLHSGENFDQEVIQLELDTPVTTGQEVGINFAAHQMQFGSVAGGFFNRPGTIQIYGIETGSPITTGTNGISGSPSVLNVSTPADIAANPDVDLLGETAVIDHTTEWREYLISFTATRNYDRILIVPVADGSSAPAINSSGGVSGTDRSTYLAIDAINFGTLVDRDTDSDGIADRLDIDSDNDGITDNIEAQATGSYIAPSGVGGAMQDADNDGLDDRYDATSTGGAVGSTGLTPVDTDNDGDDDYLDTDSDDEGGNDTVEAGLGTGPATGLSNIGNDADGDGLFDVFETQNGTSTTDGFNVNESRATGALSLPDIDGDAIPGSITPLTADVDFRDARDDSNDPPVAFDDRIAAEPGAPVNIDVRDDNGSGADTEPDGDALTVTGIIDLANPGTVIAITPTSPNVTLASGTQIQLQPNGSLNVTLANNGSQSETFAYRVSDPEGLTAQAAVTLLADTDGDGVADADDIDDDNDGILDTVEQRFGGGFQVPIWNVLNFQEPTINGGDTNFINGTGNMQPLAFGSGVAAAQSTVPDPNHIAIDGLDSATLGEAIANGDYIDMAFTAALDTRIVNAIMSVYSDGANPNVSGMNGTWMLSTDGGATFSTFADSDFDTVSLHSATGVTNQADLIVEPVIRAGQTATVRLYLHGSPFTSGNIDDLGLTLAGPPQDTDSDGVFDYLDLDSDNDGISDLEESGNAAGLALDANSDGTLSLNEAGASGANEAGDADGDGLLDVFDADDTDTSGAASQGTTPRQTDGDGIADYLDLDSDGDGIADTIEARPTAGFVTNDGDVTDNDADGDGVLDIFDSNDGTTGVFGGTFTASVNTDALINNNADSVADYLDTDSDGDGILDSAESGLTPGADANGDGIGDGTGASYADPDGFAAGNTPSNVLSNEVGDTSEVAYRELDRPPLIDLNSAATDGDANIDFSVTYTEGDALTPITSSADGNDRGDGDLTTLTITAGSISDGDNEILSIGGTEFPLNTTLTSPTTLTLGSGAQVDVSYNATTGIFSIVETPGDDGIITDADMDAIIASVSYRHASNAPTAGDRTFAFQLTDDGGNTSSVATATVTVQPVLTPPVIVPDPDGDNSPGGKFLNTFIENGNPVPIIDTDATIDDVDSSVIENATIILTNPFPGDSLQVSIPPTISGISAMPIMTLPGGSLQLELVSSSASLSDMVAAIQSITFSNNTEDPDPTQRTLTVTLTDDSGTTGSPVTVCVDVIPVNDRPVIDLDRDNSTATGDDYEGTYTENDPAVPIIDIGDNLIADLDDPNMQSATVTLTNASPEDVISIDPGYTPPASLSVTVTGNVVNLVGDASITDYQAALEAIRFEATGDNPAAGDRIFDVVVNDGQDDSNVATSTITIVAVNDAPIPQNPLNPGVEDDAMPPQTGDDSAPLTAFDVKPYFTDPDDTVLTYSLGLDTPLWLSIDTNTGEITGTPPADASQNTSVAGNADGVYTITVIATDPAGLTGDTTIEYTISNPAPDAVDDAFFATEDGPDVTGNILNANPTSPDNDPDGDTITVTEINGNAALVGQQVAGSNGGLIRVFASGDFIFDDNGDFDDLSVGQTRDTTITYTIDDGEGGTDTATVTVTVQGANDDPVVVAPLPNQTFVDGETITFATAGAFGDPDGNDTLTYSATNLPAGLTIDANTGVISGTIDNSASQSSGQSSVQGRYRIFVTADDGNGGTVTDLVRFDISNPPPVATDDAASVAEDDANVTFNAITDDNGNGPDADTAPDSDDLVISEIDSDAANVGTPVPGDNGGTFTVLADGSVTFEPGDDFQSLDDAETVVTTITYQVSDGEGGFDTATISVTVNGANDAPEPEVPGDPNPPADPNDYIPDQSGTDSTPLTPFDTSVYFKDPDTNDTLTFSSPDIPAWLTLDPNTGIITGTPPADASTGGPNSDGEYPFTIEVSDGDETFSTTLTYNIGNPPPVANDDTYTLDEDTVLTVPVATGVIDNNDTDPDNDPLTVTQLNGDPLAVGVATTLPSGATVTLNADGSFTYDPTTAFDDLADGETGTDSFTYQIGDGDGGFDTATVDFTITGVNDAPIAIDDVFDHTENGTPTTGNVLDPNPTAPDSDPDASDVLTVTEVDGSGTGVGSPVAGDAGGLFTISATGDLVFNDNGEFEDLAVGETRDTAVTYTIDDGNGGTDTATVTVTVTGTNDAPEPEVPGDPNPPADPNDYTPQQTGTDGAPVTAFDLTPYFDDPDTSDTLTLTIDPADLPDGLTFNGSQITGTPGSDASQNTNVPGGAAGTYEIPVTATDGNGGTFTTTLTYVIGNQPPVAQDDALTTDEDTVINGSVFDDNANGIDTDDPDGDVITVTQVGGLAVNVGQPVAGSNGGTFTINPDGTYSFDPGDDFNGLAVGETDSTTINYRISDGQGGFDIAVVTVLINGVNDAPEVIDPDDPGDPDNPNPAPDPDTVVPVQTVSDGEDFATVPLVDLSNYTQDPDQTDDPNLVFTATDPLPAGLTLNPDGTVTGTVDPSASQGGPNGDGVYPVVVTVTDPQGASATLTLTIDASNVDPVAVDDASSGTEDEVQTGNVITDAATGDADGAPDSDPVTVTEVEGTPVVPGTPLVVNLTNGTLNIDDTGAWTFTPNGNANALDDGETLQEMVTYTISDGEGGTDTATLTIDITGINDPVVVKDPNDPETDPEDPEYSPENPKPIPDPDNLIADVTYNDGETIVPIPAGDYFGDAEDDTITFSAADLPTGLTIDPATGEISGTLDSNASQEGNTPTPGEHLVTITATDPQGNTATTTVTITATNLPVIAENDDITGDEDTVVSGSVFADNGNGEDRDTAPDNDPLAVLDVDGAEVFVGREVAGSNGGTFVINSDGTFTFDPGNDFQSLGLGESATTTIGYTVTDSDGSTDFALVTVSVEGVNDGPIPIDPEQPEVPNPNDPDAPPTDPDDPREPPLDPDNYIPVQNVVDGDPATPPLDLTPYFGDPDANDDVVLSLDPNDLPPGLTFDPLTGVISGTPDNSASQGGDPLNPGSYTIEVTATDPSGLSFTTNVTYIVENLPPEARDDALTGDEDTPFGANVFDDNGGGIDQDTPPDSDDVVVSAVDGDPANIGQPASGSGGGTFTINDDGTVNFDPGIDFQDLDVGESRTTEVSYTISDGEGGADTATVTVTVTGVNDAPEVIDPENPGDPKDPETPADPDNVIPDQTGEDGVPLTPLDITPYFIDVDGEPLTFAFDPADPDVPGWLSIDPVTGEITGTPPSDASQGGPAGDGVYPITVTASDPDGATVTTTIDFTITNLPPIAQNDLVTHPEDGVSTGSVFADNGNGPDGDTTPDNDPIVVGAVGNDPSSVGQPVAGSAGGAFTINEDGTYSFDPGIDFQDLDDGETRTTEVTYTIDDGNGGTDTATLVVTVEGANDAPEVIDPENPGDPKDPDTPPDPDNVIPDQTGSDATPITPLDVSIYFTDVDGEPLTFGFDPGDPNVPPWLSIDPQTGVVTGTPPSDASIGGPNGDGNYPITIVATDPDGESVTTTVDYEIDNPPPVTTGLPDQVETVGESFTYDTGPSFGDPDGDTLTFTADNLPPGLSIDPQTGVISGDIDPAAVSLAPNGDGIYRVTVTAHDGQGGMVKTGFVFEVLDAFVPTGEQPPSDPPGIQPPDGDPGPVKPDLIVDKTVNEINPLGSNSGLFDRNHPLTEALFEISPLGNAQALDTNGHPVSQAIDWIERSREALANSPIDADPGSGFKYWLGDDGVIASVGVGNDEIIVRTLVWNGVIFVELIGDSTDLVWEAESLNGRNPGREIEGYGSNLFAIKTVSDDRFSEMVVRGARADGNEIVLDINLRLSDGQLGELRASREQAQGFTGQLQTVLNRPMMEARSLLQKQM